MDEQKNTLSTMSEVDYLRGENLILQAQNEYLMNRIIELYEEIINKNE